MPRRWKCAACGGSNPAGTRFCGHCGAPAAGQAPLRPKSSTEPAIAEAPESVSSGGPSEPGEKGRPAEERRLVTALFADISGFTTLADKLDEDELHEIVAPVIARLAGVAERYGGFIAKYAGDALLVFFGAPTAREDDAVRALMVALGMHEELARCLNELPSEAAHLQLHVGVNSGTVVSGMFGGQIREDYSILGDAVNLAQRLESVAPAGATYVGESTYRLTKDRFEFEYVGKQTLKGKSEPVPAYRLIRALTSPSRSFALELAGALVGRERELAAFTGVIHALREGHGSFVSVTGEPGVGKSRLTEELRRLAGTRGTRWLDTRCLSYGAGLAYWPYAELLRQLAGISIEDAPEKAGSQLASALQAAGVQDALPYFARLLGLRVPESSPDVSQLEPEAFRRALHEAFATLVRALASEGPLVLAIEDIHWADSASVAQTTELARLCPEERFMLYLIARPEAKPVIANISAEIPESLRLTLDLQPLDRAGGQALVEALTGGPAPKPLLDLITRRAAGNPFFIKEVVRSVQDSGAMVRENGSWRMLPGWDSRTVPATIEGVLAARIDLLPPNIATVLQVGSVIGRQVLVALLRGVADVPDVDEALKQLVQGGFLDPTDGDDEQSLRFHHVLIQDVAYSRLLRRQRQELHRKVAEVGEALYGSGDDIIDLLARHCYLGKAGSKAADYLLRAGERSKQLFANEEAILHLKRATEVVKSHPQMVERLPGILLDLADLQGVIGDYDNALRIFGEVRASTNDARAWRGMASTLRRKGQFDEALSLLDEAVGSKGLPAGDLAPLWLERGWVLSMAGRQDEARQALEAGLKAAGSRKDEVAAKLLLQLAFVEIFAGSSERALDPAKEAERIFEETGLTREIAPALRMQAVASNHLDRHDDAAMLYRRALELAERTGSVEEIATCLVNLGDTEMKRGFLEEAIACDRRAIDEFRRIRHPSGEATAHANIAEKLVRVGQLEEASGHIKSAIELARPIGHTIVVAGATQVMASILLRQGSLVEAAERAEEAGALFKDIGAMPYVSEALEMAAEAWEQAGETERARDARARSASPSA